MLRKHCFILIHLSKTWLWEKHVMNFEAKSKLLYSEVSAIFTHLRQHVTLPTNQLSIPSFTFVSMKEQNCEFLFWGEELQPLQQCRPWVPSAMWTGFSDFSGGRLRSPPLQESFFHEKCPGSSPQVPGLQLTLRHVRACVWGQHTVE